MKSFSYPEMDNRAHTAEVSKLCYCAEFMSVISVSWDCSINIHDESDSERGILLRKLLGGHTADITSLSFSFNLSLIASGSSDNSLQIWDYEFGRLDGSCIGHVSGILCLRFADPFPVLISSDNSGNICFWGMRPSRYKCKCLYQMKNQHHSGGAAVASVNCMTVHSARLEDTLTTSTQPNQQSQFATYLLIAGDDKGFISIWNILPLLTRLDEQIYVSPLDKPFECANPNRNLRVDATGMVRKLKNGPEWAAFTKRDPSSTFFFTSGTPVAGDDARLMQCVSRWSAHSDVVYSVQMVTEPETLVTCSFDRQVKIWTLDGRCLGMLMQGELEASRRPWRFVVDYDARERRKEADAEPVIDDIHRLVLEDEREGARRRRTARAAAAAEHDALLAEASVLEEITRTYLPPIAANNRGGAGGWSLGGAAPGLPPLRKTPRRKPVTVATAGRSTFLSPRQQRVLVSQSPRSARSSSSAESPRHRL